MQDPELHVRALLSKANYKLFYDYPVDCCYRVICSKYTTTDMIKEMIIGYCEFNFHFFETISHYGDEIYIKALKTSINTLLFELSRMSDEKSMLNEALELYVKLNLVSVSSKKYLFIKYIVMQKLIWFLKKIRSMNREYILTYDKCVKDEFHQIKGLVNYRNKLIRLFQKSHY